MVCVNAHIDRTMWSVKFFPGMFGCLDGLFVDYNPDFALETVIDILRADLDKLNLLFITTRIYATTNVHSRTRAHGIYANTNVEFSSFFIGPIQPRPPCLAYHTTRESIIPLILEEGLLPSSDERKSSSFPDTEGVIHLSERLKTHGDDRGIDWWKVELEADSKYAGESWGILEVDLTGLNGARIYQDPHSHTGICVDKIDYIPQRLIRRLDLTKCL
jgi:hypothetical protein